MINFVHYLVNSHLKWTRWTNLSPPKKESLPRKTQWCTTHISELACLKKKLTSNSHATKSSQCQTIFRRMKFTHLIRVFPNYNQKDIKQMTKSDQKMWSKGLKRHSKGLKTNLKKVIWKIFAKNVLRSLTGWGVCNLQDLYFSLTIRMVTSQASNIKHISGKPGKCLLGLLIMTHISKLITLFGLQAEPFYGTCNSELREINKKN